ncbi:hypothetical protein H311_01770 [Anncaliia algerae PRA109]|nr:hypothetical protein H311_01770 [Anncaliia algerae PRA109]
MDLVKNKRSRDKYLWRCLFKTCVVYKKYFSLREESFFRDFKIDLKSEMLTIIKYSCRQQKYQINQSMDYAVKTIKKVIDKLVDLMLQTEFSSNKLDGPGNIVQVDETMLNFKYKSHRGRPTKNKADSPCIVKPMRAFLEHMQPSLMVKKKTPLFL